MSDSNPANFSFRLRKGMKQSATPSQILELNYIPSEAAASSTSETSSYQFRSTNLQADPASASASSEPKLVSESAISRLALAQELEKLRNLPVEDPVGSEDIYGLDTQIHYFTNSFEWVNGGPGGCIASPDSKSKVQPTAAQRETFKHVVDKLMKAASELNA